MSDTVTSTNTALIEPENDPPAAASRLTSKLICQMVMSPLRPSLAMKSAPFKPAAYPAHTCNGKFILLLSTIINNHLSFVIQASPDHKISLDTG